MPCIPLSVLTPGLRLALILPLGEEKDAPPATLGSLVMAPFSWCYLMLTQARLDTCCSRSLMWLPQHDVQTALPKLMTRTFPPRNP